VSDISSQEFRFIIDHQKQYGDIVSPQRVQRKIYRTAAYNLQQPADKNDTTEYFRLRAIASAFHNTQVDSLIFNYDLQLYDLNNQWSRYETTAIKGTSTYEWNDYSQLKHIADIFSKRVTNPSSLKEAATWAKRSAELKPEYGNTLLYAQLLEKTGEKNNAKKVAHDAVDIASKINSNHAEADQILQR